MAFVSYLRAHHFANLYYERSTNGRGAHAYFLLEKDGLSVPAVKNILLKKLQPWLNHLAKGFDVELVEIKGLPPEATWGDRRYDLTSYKAGVLAKLPRGIFDRFAELQETTVLNAKTLAMEVPDIAPPVQEKKKAVVGSSSMKHIDCSEMKIYRRIGERTAERGNSDDEWSAYCAGRRCCDLSDARQLVEPTHERGWIIAVGSI